LWHEINAVELFQSRAGYTLQRHCLKQLNHQLADANAGLSALATTDPLTGLPNRRLFEKRMTSEWQRALREEACLAIVVIDVDHFKLYNDRYGHPAGDKCMRQVAAAIDGARRSVDVVARMGARNSLCCCLMPTLRALRRSPSASGSRSNSSDSSICTITDVL
jgi:PleD family two-component response regulator